MLIILFQWPHLIPNILVKQKLFFIDFSVKIGHALHHLKQGKVRTKLH